MKRIKRFNNFNAPINEVSVDNTYLDNVKTTKDGGTGPFAEAPRTKGKTWGLDFEKSPRFRNTYIVVFPDYLVKQIIEVVKDKNGEVISPEILNGIEIETEGESGFNRTHFPDGITSSLRGIGLGYIIYEEFIKFLGYASSEHNASNLAQKVWRKVSDDPDFFGICYNKGILVFDSKMDDNYKISDIVIGYLSDKGFDIDFYDEELEKILKEKNLHIDQKLIEILKKGQEDFKYKKRLSKLLNDIDAAAWEIKNKNKDKENISIGDCTSIHTSKYIKNTIFPKIEKLKEEASEEKTEFGEKEEKVIERIKARYSWFLSQAAHDITDGMKKVYDKHSLEKVKSEIDSLNDYIELLGIRKQVDNQLDAFKYYDLRKKLNETFRTKGYEATLNFYNTYIKEQIKDMKINVRDDYTWCEDLFIRYKKQFPDVEGSDKKSIDLSVDKHFELQMRAYKTILFAIYDKISKKMEKSYFDGGYDKAKSYFDSVNKKKLDQITIDIEDDNGYGLKKGDVVKLSALKHLENRLEAYSKQPTPPQKPIPTPPTPPQKPIPTPPTPKSEEPREKETKVPQRTVLQRFADFLGF